MEDLGAPQSGTISEQQATRLAINDGAFTSDPARILFDCAIGSLQAWPAAEGDTAVGLSFYANFSHVGETSSYTSATHNLTAADARNLAAALLRAANHADAVKKITHQVAS